MRYRGRHRRGRVRVPVAMVLSLAVWAAACGDDGEVTEPGSSTTAVVSTGETATTAAGASGAEDEPVAGGELVLGTYSEPSSLDPTVTAGSGSTGGIELIALYDTLVRFDPEAGTFVPRLAKSLEPNSDASVWTLTLQPDVVFSDGSPLDAAAVKSSIERHVAPTSRSIYRNAVSKIDAMTVVDGQTLTIELEEPWGGFPVVLATNAGMITNPAAVAAAGENFGVAPGDLGAGPFVLDYFRPKEGIRVARNETYWDGAAPLDAVRFVTLAGPEATYESFLAGQLDAAVINDTEVAERVVADGTQNWEFLLQGAQILLLNSGIVNPEGQTTSPTSDPRLRKAIAMAIDLDQLNDRVWGGSAEVSTELFHETSKWYAGVPGPQYDPEEAKRLVEAVKADGWDGTVRITCSNQPVHVDLSLAIQAMLGAVGIAVDVTNDIDTSELINTVFVKRDFDLVCWAQQSDDSLWYFQLSSNYASESKRFGYESDAFDAALNDARAATDDAAAKPAYKKMAEILAEDVPIVPLQSALPQRVVYSEQVHEIDVGGARGNIYLDKTWMSPNG